MSCNKKYDDLLFAVLNNEGCIEAFLDEIFSFLFRRTDFFRILDESSPKHGFPPGVASKLVYYTFVKYSRMQLQNERHNNVPVETPIPESTQEVIVETSEPEPLVSEEQNEKESLNQSVQQLDATTIDNLPEQGTDCHDESDSDQPHRYESYSECYNGASYDNYCWSQTINDIDIQIKVPSDANSGKCIKMTISNTHLKAEAFENDSWIVLVDGDLTWKINVEGSTWTLVPGRHVHVYLEKMQERWWDALLVGEPKIDVQKIDASRPYEDLDKESQAKIDELIYNQHQKFLGNRTAPQTKVLEVLKEAWNNDSSPFKGQSFDPNNVDILPNSDISL